MVDKLRTRLFSWSSKLLSAGGKIILIWHVLSSMSLYLLQVLHPPKLVLGRMGKICHSFWWDRNSDKGIHWFSWEKLCYPIEEGGLDFRDFGDMAKAFACKLWWKLRVDDSIWVNFMQKTYVKGCHPPHSTTF